MAKPRNVTYVKYLPEVGSVVKIGIPGEYCPFEAMIAGRIPYNAKSALARKLPNETVEVEEAIFCLTFVPGGYDPTLVHTITGWKMFSKDSHEPIIVEVTTYSSLRH